MLTFVTLTNNELIMKKILFSLFALMAVMTVQAQSICGTWRTMQPVVETDEDGSFSAQSYTYTFNEDGTYNMVNELTESSQPAPTMALEIACSIELNGTYTLNDNQLTLTPDINTYKAEVLSVSMNGKVTEEPMVVNNIKSMLNNPMVKNEMAAPQNLTIKLAEPMLEMTDEEETISLMRLSTITN